LNITHLKKLEEYNYNLDINHDKFSSFGDSELLKLFLRAFASDWLKDRFIETFKTLYNEVEVNKKAMYVSYNIEYGGGIAIGVGVKAIGRFERFYIFDLIEVLQWIFDNVEDAKDRFEYLIPFPVEINDNGVVSLKSPANSDMFEQFLLID
jgi:hypothetical protein